jgi:hypothetical protein
MERKALIWIICLGLFAVFAVQSNAFEFDVWNSGISLTEAMKIAEFNDVPLTTAGAMKPCQRGKEHYRPERMKDAQKSRNFCYKDTVVGKPALVTLHFTPMSKKLCNVVIYWANADKAQQKEVLFVLSEKYGDPLKYSPVKDQFPVTPDIRLENPLSETQFFGVDQQNIICVQYVEKRKSSLIVIYNDISMAKQEQTEAEAFEQYLKTRYRQQADNRM